MNISGDSSVVELPRPGDDGGSIPTSPLQRLRKSDWVVAGCDMDTARRFVRAEHYARGASNTATYLHGLYPAAWHWFSECVGVAWWIPPTRSAAEATYPPNWQGVLSLSRLAIAAHVPKNAASFLLAHSMRMIDRTRWTCLVTYADEWQGHVGTIYRATGWEYCGLTKPERVYIKNGAMIARKAGPRTRTHAEMSALGAECLGAFAKHKFRHISRVEG